MSEQGTAAWAAERLGKATASRISDIVARTKTGWGASRANYMAELVAERLTGVPYPSYTNAAMQWGTDMEPVARAAYEFYTNTEVELVGFVPHPTIAMSGASPDGLVGKKGLIEIKCPNTATHIATLLGSPIDEKYVTQVQWQLACANRLWCDWVSFDARLPEEMRLFTRRIPRDNETIANLEVIVHSFLMEIDEKVATLRKHYGVRQAA